MVSYPAKDWNDSIVNVLQWWLREALCAMESDSDLRLRFMDGPFECRLKRCSADECLVTTIDLDGIEEGFDTTIRLSEFVKELHAVVLQTLNACYGKGWKSNGLADLQTTLESVDRSK
jgi:hypothetical protein